MAASRKFAVFDIDGTLIRWQLFHAIIDRLAKAGAIPAEAYQKAHDARMTWKKRGDPEVFRAYEHELVHAYVDALPLIPVAAFQRALESAFAEHKDQAYAYTRGLIRELKSKNYLLFAISASQAEAVALVADYYGFDDYVGTIYEQKNGRFTGELDLVAHKKPEALQRLIAKHHVDMQGSIAVGDTESDAAMLEMVEYPIAFNPNKKLFQRAQATGWKVVIERKNMIYELEPKDGGYCLAKTNA